MRGWVEIIKDSVPDHSKDIRLNLDAVINRSLLSEVDTHACAVAAAIAAGNGELAHAIITSGKLDEFPKEVEAAKTAARQLGSHRHSIRHSR